MALAPGDAEVLANSGLFAVLMGRFDVGLAAARHAVTLDPLNPQGHEVLGEALFWARRHQEAVAAFDEVIRLEPDFKRAYGFRGVAYSPITGWVTFRVRALHVRQSRITGRACGALH
jgi:tetratricopeptide (TPR) repeat protein